MQHGVPASPVPLATDIFRGGVLSLRGLCQAIPAQRWLDEGQDHKGGQPKRCPVHAGELQRNLPGKGLRQHWLEAQGAPPSFENAGGNRHHLDPPYPGQGRSRSHGSFPRNFEAAGQ